MIKDCIFMCFPVIGTVCKLHFKCFSFVQFLSVCLILYNEYSSVFPAIDIHVLIRRNEEGMKNEKHIGTQKFFHKNISKKPRTREVVLVTQKFLLSK